MSRDLCFIHSSADDAGLTPAEFRVYCHLLRRAGRKGEAWAARVSIAEKCRLDLKTVQRCLNSLVARQLLRKEKRTGLPSLYRPTHHAEWKPDPNGTLTQTTPQVAERVKGQPKRHSTHLTQTTPHKGFPSEGAPNKLLPIAFEIPVALSTPEFQSAWSEWIEYRKSKRKPVSLFAAKKQLAELEAVGPQRAIAAINLSIAKDWQGIFEGNRNGTKPQDHRAAKAAREYEEQIEIPRL